jgi:hypothetical protein
MKMRGTKTTNGLYTHHQNKKEKTMKAEERKSIITETARVYFKSDQLGPRNYKKVEDVIKDLEDGKALNPQGWYKKWNDLK